MNPVQFSSGLTCLFDWLCLFLNISNDLSNWFCLLGFYFLLMLISHSSSSYFFWTVLFTPVHSVDAKSYPGQSGWIHELWRSGYELPHISHCKEAPNQGMNVHQLVWHNFQSQYFPCWTLTLHYVFPWTLHLIHWHLQIKVPKLAAWQNLWQVSTILQPELHVSQC